MSDDSAVTAAELDELQAYLADPPYGGNHYVGSPHSFSRMKRAADAFASLRKQLDEAREATSIAQLVVREQLREALDDNAKKDAALRKIAALDHKNAATNMAAYKAVQIATNAITPASQEAPASPAADMVLVPRDDLQTLIEQADSMAFERSSQDYEQFGRPQYIENAYGWLLAPASSSPGLLKWAVSRWQDEVANRPLVNVHRRSLDTTWRQVIRFAGGDPEALIGPSHDDLSPLPEKNDD